MRELKSLKKVINRNKKINIKGQKGITLISLGVMIVVIAIIGSISFSTGKNTIQLAMREERIAELKVMQTEINNLYEKYRFNEEIYVKGENSAISGNNILNIGEDCSIVSLEASQAMNAVGVTDMSKYRYLSTEYLKKLGIEGVEQEYIVDIETRTVICLKSFKYDGTTVYSLNQIPGEQFNVDYKPYL